jgi:PAS domain S-box-containing protein
MKYKSSEMMCLDIYLSSLSDKEHDKIKHQIKSSKAKTSPLSSWDIYRPNYFKTLDKERKKRDLKVVNSFFKKEKWSNDFQSVFKNQEFEALVITDLNQRIIWVNEGFTKMTGYSKDFAINKTPHFLQGENTCSSVKKKIRTKLKKSHPFKEVITNYRKDNSVYNCEVRIIPLYCNEKVTHFLALEKEVI